MISSPTLQPDRLLRRGALVLILSTAAALVTLGFYLYWPAAAVAAASLESPPVSSNVDLTSTRSSR
jgi:hypothetical protein